jgi:hypothetical protein
MNIFKKLTGAGDGTKSPQNPSGQNEATERRRARQEAKLIVRPEIPNHLYVPPKFVAKVASFADEPLVTDEEIVELRALQVQYERANDFLNAHFRHTAKQKFREQQIATSKEVLEGGGNEASAREGWTLEDWQQDFDVKKRALKSDLRRVCAEAVPIAVRVAGRLGAVAANLVEHFEEVELNYSEGWGLEFSESKVLQLLRYVAKHPEQLITACATTSPRHVLAFVDFTIPPAN